MESAIPLDYLLRYVEQPRHARLVEGIKRRVASIADLLETATQEAYDFYDELFEREGPQALNHYAWLTVEIGNFYLAINQEQKAHELFFEAWKNFSNPQNRGHDDKAHKIVKEYPKLLAFIEVADYYKKNQDIAKRYGIMILK